MAATSSDAIANLRELIEKAAAVAGTDRVGSISEEMTFRQWCEMLTTDGGLKIDRKPFKLSDRPALVPLYDAIPVTKQEAAQRTLVLQKATQLGATVWEVPADVYMARKFGPVNIGLFLPDQATASFKSEHRFMPIIRSSSVLYRELTHRFDAEGKETRIGEGNVLTRQVAGLRPRLRDGHRPDGRLVRCHHQAPATGWTASRGACRRDLWR